MSRSAGGEVVVVVHCCQTAQMKFALKKLRGTRPEWRLQVLARECAQTAWLANEDSVEKVHWIAPGQELSDIRCDRLVFPLLNRGWEALRRAAKRIPGERLEMDYSGALRRLSYRRLLFSVIRCPNRATREFETFLRRLPPPLMGSKVLVAKSADRGLVEATRPLWSSAIPADSGVVVVAGSVGWREFRRLRGERFDSAIVFFSGEHGFLRLKLLPFLLGVSRVLTINESGHHWTIRASETPLLIAKRALRGVRPPTRHPRILLIQTETAAYVGAALERLKQRPLYPQAEIVLLCREDDRGTFEGRPEISHLLTYGRAFSAANLGLWKRLRDLEPDIVCAIFSGRGVFRAAKALFFTFADVPLLAFNAGLDCYPVKPRSLPWLLRRDKPLFGETTLPSGIPVLLIQTESWEYTLAALRKLRGRSLYPNARVTLLCRRSDAYRFRDEPGVAAVETFESLRQRGWLKVWRGLRKDRAAVAVAIFSGRPVFRKARLLFLSLAGFPRLVFNSGLDAYWLGPRSILRLVRREPLLFGLQARKRAEALLIQTESRKTTLEAVKLMLSGRVVPQEKITVFCRDDGRSRFAEQAGVDRVYSWSPGLKWRNLKTIWRLARMNWDVSAAILSGRDIFRAQKLLFFILPARERLVINENLDCYYVKRSRWGRYFRLPSLVAPRSRHRGVLEPIVRQILKAILFVPRFAFLMGWLTVAKLRRARSME